jgi:hypothetical protein
MQNGMSDTLRILADRLMKCSDCYLTTSDLMARRVLKDKFVAFLVTFSVVLITTFFSFFK